MAALQQELTRLKEKIAELRRRMGGTHAAADEDVQARARACMQALQAMSSKRLSALHAGTPPMEAPCSCTARA